MKRILFVFVFLSVLFVSCSDNYKILSENLVNSVNLKIYYANESRDKVFEKPVMLRGHVIQSLSFAVVDNTKVNAIYIVRYKNENYDKVMIMLKDDNYFYNHKSPAVLVTEINGELVAAARALPEMKTKILLFPASYLSTSYDKYLLKE